MILICGADNLTVDQLPLNDTLSYSLLDAPNKITVALIMGIRKPDVSRCYVNSKYSSSKINPECASKVVFFDNDEALLSLLSVAPASEETESESEVEVDKEVVVPSMTTDADIDVASEMIGEQDIQDSSTSDVDEPIEDEVDEAEITEAVDNNEDIPLSTPDALHETDILHSKLKSMEGILTQNRECLKKMTEERDEVYDYAATQLEEQAHQYDAKLAEASEAIASLQEQLKNAQPAQTGLALFNVYANKCKAILKSGISKKYDNIYAIAAGSYDSVTALHQSVALLCASGYDGYVIDLMGDPAFGSTLFQLKYRYLQLAKTPQGAAQLVQLAQQEIVNAMYQHDKDFVNYLRHLNDLDDTAQTNFWKAKVCGTSFYHDIALLSYDWVSLLDTMSSVANGRKIVFVLPPVTTFVGRYLASYLGAGIAVSVSTICAPSALISTQSNLATMPQARIKLLAMNYVKIEDTDRMLKGELNKKFVIKLFKAVSLFANPEPTRADFESAITGNSKIWAEVFSNSTNTR